MSAQEKLEYAAWIQRRRENHHKALEALAAQVGYQTEGLKLWRQLRRVESWAYSKSLAFCNGQIETEDWELVKVEARARLQKVFGGKLPQGIRINADARGHALKLDSDKVAIPQGMETDWGGDGILAAEID